jgi:D-alanyl-D-alanine carboxypeptidase (penicillin-binding protein 5/6)
MKKIIPILSLACALSAAVPAAAFDTKAKAMFLVDFDSGAELVSKNADDLMPPSSMVKLMTLALLFDAVKSGNLTMDDTMPVSANADYQNPTWYPASKICLVQGQNLKVRDAMQSLIVQSAGDASVVVAEKLAGSEAAFTTMMQQKAREIGMPLSTFGNASGLPNPGNLMTVRELAVLGAYIVSQHPDLYHMFSTKRFEFDDYKNNWCREWGRTHTLNYNKLLFIMPAADGMKTGHTDDGGYGMVASAKIGGRRLIAVINGLRAKNHNALAEEAKKLLNHGFSTTVNRIFYHPGDKVLEVPVWYGRQSNVVATVSKTFAVTLKKNQPVTGLRVFARYDEPVQAPVKKGQQIGEIFAELDGKIIARAPLVAADKVSKTQFFGRVWKNIQVIFGGRS